MSKRIYVGNLPFTATEDQVRGAFSVHGQVHKVSIITDRESGRPRGFCFVEMDEVGGARAIEQLNGTDLGGRTLVVNQAKEREQRPRYDDRSHGRGGRGRDRRERDDR